MSNDFETVRKGLQFYPEFDEDMQVADEASAALDCIEAEVERLRVVEAEALAVITGTNAEVERLRERVKYLEGRVPGDGWVRVEEVERLKGDINELTHEAWNWVKENEQLRAENGRIMNTFQKAQAENRAEVERLRAALERIAIQPASSPDMAWAAEVAENALAGEKE